MVDRHQQAEQDDTVGHGTFLLFVVWLLLLVALCGCFLIVGIVDA